MTFARIVVRGCVVGAAFGTATGGAVMSLSWLVVGTFFGAVLGAPLGGAAGALIGVWLAALHRSHAPRQVLRVCVVAPWLSAGVLVLAKVAAAGSGVNVAPAVVLVAFNVALACFTATYVVSGDGWIEVGACRRRRPLADIAGRVCIAGLVVGAALGGLAGGIIAVVTHPPTAPVAVVEGGILGGVSGVVLALVLFELTLVVTLAFGRASV
jgi:hypothetical protein